MKKRFISLVAAAALVGGIAIASTPATSQAGTVTVKGDTQATLYGYIAYEGGWSKKLGNDYIPMLDAPVPVEKTVESKKVRFKTTANESRFGFAFKNTDANVSGVIEAHFYTGSFGLRRAFVKHNFDSFYVLLGQEWGLEEFHSFSANFNAPVGFGGVGRMPQLRVGTNLNMGNANLELDFAFEDSTNVALEKDYGIRNPMPAMAAKVAVSFETGFGAPARIYTWGRIHPLKLTIGSGNNYKEKSKTPVAFGAGVNIPISMVTLAGEYIYEKGMTEITGVKPDSYYYDGTNWKAQKSDTFEIGAKIAPTECTSFAFGYDYTKFKKNLDIAKDKYQTYFVNASVKTTKYTTLILEYDHVKLSDSTPNTDSLKGDAFGFKYVYSF